jgi:FKBP-type peptidyl-prolyl cis-trans isomerase SlyD
MQVQRDRVVSIHYVLRDTEGEIIDQSTAGQPLAYLHGHGNIVPGLEQAIEGHERGDEIQTTVSPDDGYGPYREELVQDISREAFQGVDELAPGMSFRAESEAGPMIVTVMDVGDDEVTVDGNHMLAGQTLDFQVNIADVRKASDAEIEHGHVHDGQAANEG